jgi:hypothetical protein
MATAAARATDMARVTAKASTTEYMLREQKSGLRANAVQLSTERHFYFAQRKRL